MRYYEPRKKFSKTIGSVGFYALIACCLLAIGALSYFAVVKINTDNKDIIDKDNNSAYESKPNQYNSNNDLPIKEPSGEVDKPVSSVPYESEEPKEEKPKVEKISFMMPVENGTVIKGYSTDTLQFSSTYGDMRLHLGLDISCNKSSYVKSCAKGIVKTISENAELGRYIEIEHSDGTVIRYCGLESINVINNEAVNGGDVIGTVGTVTQECMDKSHIHIEVYRDSKPINPSLILGS